MNKSRRGKVEFEEAREMLSAPTREPHPVLWWQIPSKGSAPQSQAQHHLWRAERVQFWHSSPTPGESWHPAGIQGNHWQPGGTAKKTPEQGEPLHPVLHFLTNKDALNLFSTYNWPRLCSCQEKKKPTKLLKNPKDSDTEGAQGSAGRCLQPCWSNWPIPEPPALPCSG